MTKKKKLPAMAVDVKVVVCKDCHLHIFMLDENGKELAEFMLSNRDEYNGFAYILYQSAIDAFGNIGNEGVMLQ